MGFFPPPTLDEGEEILRTVNANRTQGWRAVGGRLYITNQRLRFAANAIDRRTAGRDWTAHRNEVTEVTAAARTLQGGPFSGGLRRRLSIACPAGGAQFVVNGVDELVDFVRTWVDQASS